MAEAMKGPTTNTQSPAHSAEPGEFERPTGWRYKSLKVGPITLPWYASPESQLVLVSFVCFLCPGMWNALQGLGGAGQLNASSSDKANSALYAAFAVVGFFAGTIVNALGIRIALSFGGLGYCVYISSYLSYNYTHNLGYVVFSGLLLGCCAGILWSAQGAIMMSYPPERLKGRYISMFWMIFNLGGVIGSLVLLGLNFHKEENGTVNSEICIDSEKYVKDNSGKPDTVSNPTYVGFLVLTFLGACLSWTLIDAKHVVRRDGSKIILMKHPTWKTEIVGLWESLRYDPYIIFLFPMFFASNWFYTYQFQNVNLARLNLRTRGLNGTLYWLAQMFGALMFGFALDFPNIRRTTRAKAAWVVMFLLTFAIWGGGYVFQTKYNRGGVSNKESCTPYDWTSNGYIGPMFLYIFYGFYDAAWQTCVYWFMGAITNNSRKLANFAGFYKGIQSAGAAIIWGLDSMDNAPPFMNLFASCWVLLACSLVIALPVMLLKIKDAVPVEEDLKFTDETIEDVIGHRVNYDSPKQERV